MLFSFFLIIFINYLYFYIFRAIIFFRNLPKRNFNMLEKIKSSKNVFYEIISILYLPLTSVYLEIALAIECKTDIFSFFLPSVLLSFAFGILLSTVSLSFKKAVFGKILASAFIFLLCLYFTVEAFVHESYHVFMNIPSIAQGTGGVLTDFSDAFIQAITGGFFSILAMFMPFIIFVLLIIFHFPYGHGENNKSSVLTFMLVIFLVFLVSGAKIIRSDNTMLGIYSNAYNFSNAVNSFGLITGTRLDLQYEIFGNPSEDNFIIEEPDIPEEIILPEPPAENESFENEEDAEIEYGYNILNIDFDNIIANTLDSSINNIHNYISHLSGTKQNKYTGLFKGKNLILIAAESFSKEVIDPELTPTLYRLYKNGFTFTDYYQPTWGGSTSTGEYSIFTGLIPTSGVGSMLKLTDGNTGFTIGNKLKDEGYFSVAYHNGSYDYYSRHLTHEKLGYEKFIAFGNGLEDKMKNGWPASDLEFFEATIADYINNQPFSVYYMTISGHGFYTDFKHGIAMKNREAVKHLEYSATVQSYIAANLELEYALSFLIDALEKEGIADDTVIALTSDHYPYALEYGDAWGNDKDYLAELYGFTYKNSAERDHNAMIIWSGCLENEYADMATEINEPTYSLDMLPTLCNLFGVPYDSRLLVGRDVFSGADALVIWPDYNWKTKYGYYNYTKKEFIPSEGSVPVSDSYIEYINNIVKNKISYSKAVLNRDYFSIVLE